MMGADVLVFCTGNIVDGANGSLWTCVCWTIVGSDDLRYIFPPVLWCYDRSLDVFGQFLLK